MARKTIAKTLEQQRTLIFNSSKPAIAPFLTEMGVDAVYLKKGEELYQTVIKLTETQQIEHQEESLAYDNYHSLKSECQGVAKHNLKIFKLASRNNKDLQDRLKLFAAKEYAIEAWVNQTKEQYNLVLNESEFLLYLARFKFTEKTLNADKAQLQRLQEARNEAMSEKGQAQEATRFRNEKMEELEDYCYELKTLASIVLVDKPQLGEMLGMIV